MGSQEAAPDVNVEEAGTVVNEAPTEAPAEAPAENDQPAEGADQPDNTGESSDNAE